MHALSAEQSFAEDIRKYVISNLPCAPAESVALRSMSVGDLLSVWFNWQSRLIAPRPRRVHVARVLRTSLAVHDAEIGLAFAHLEHLIEQGMSLAPFLSKRILIGYERQRGAAKALNRRRDLDLLLNDWGVHHLHLSTEIENSGFSKRTAPLLLGVFHPNDAYLIDIVEHGDWTREEIMANAVREWPDAGIAFELKGILPSTEPPSAAERRQLRNAGVFAPLAVDGKAYMPPTALSTAGTAMMTSRRGDLIRDDLDNFMRCHREDRAWVAGMIARAGRMPPSTYRFQFVFLEEGYGVLERHSGTLLRLR